ncbi:MAG: hypothetical protein WA160_13730 [Pseudobdellovibrio sp.]
MNIRWAFFILIAICGISVFASVSDFNQIIATNIQDQQKLAWEIQSQLGRTLEFGGNNLVNKKTLESLAQSELVTLEGSNLKIFNN